MNYRHILSIYLLLLYKRTCCSLQSSALFRLSVSGYRLTDHVISEYDTLDILECALYCLRKSSVCKSINYKRKKNQAYSKNCQLNNATKTSHPQNLLADKNYDNYQQLEKKTPKQEPVNYAKSCDALYKSGQNKTGVFSIEPDGLGAFDVRCDMTSTPGLGWTIMQRRVDGSENFYRNWTDYKVGFGNLNGEYWLGLDKIHRLSASGQNVLRVDLETFENETAYAVYKSFTVEDESDGYRLEVNTSSYTGTAGNSLRSQNRMKFTTQDVDNDGKESENCAKVMNGAWWFQRCGWVHLNGQYLGGHHNKGLQGIRWNDFKGTKYSYKISEMKVRSNEV